MRNSDGEGIAAVIALVGLIVVMLILGVNLYKTENSEPIYEQYQQQLGEFSDGSYVQISSAGRFGNTRVNVLVPDGNSDDSWKSAWYAASIVEFKFDDERAGTADVTTVQTEMMFGTSKGVSSCVIYLPESSKEQVESKMGSSTISDDVALNKTE